MTESNIKSIEDLDVFKKTHKITLDIYSITAKYPKDEIYGLVAQMRRAAVSINSNLMEGSARATSGEFRSFIGIARGSATELVYQVILSRDLGILNKEDAFRLEGNIREILRMLTGLLKSISKTK